MPEDRSLTLDFSPKEAPADPAPRPGEPPSTPAEPRRPASPPASARPASSAEEPRALTVAELDRAIKTAVEDGFGQPVWVEGELADARPAPSGHLYFCLKDEREEAAIDVVVYRSSVTARMRALCVDGARVRLRGRPTFWAPRGRLQFVADRMQPTGRGALLEALEKLKSKLASEGLFAPDRKRALPLEPRVVGVVTSPHGAAIHDICRVAFRRGGARLLLSPAQVQGAGAVESICRALSRLQRVRDLDVVIIGRGGGSTDDLGAFNEEAVVRAVAACRVPIVSAVGHDVDVTLVDFAADARAATPSQAAEMVVPDHAAQRALLHRTRLHLARAMRARLSQHQVAVERATRSLGDPRLAIAGHQQRLDDLRARLTSRLRSFVVRRRDDVSRVQRRLAFLHPRLVVARERAEAVELGHRLEAAWRASAQRRLSELGRAGARLEALSPLQVLRRGYCIVTRDDGRAVRGVDDVEVGARLHARVSDGQIHATVSGADRSEEPS